MARPEVLDRIKEAEREADEIVEQAETARKERIAEARERAEAIREEAHEEARELEEQRLATAESELEAERKEILAAGEAEREALEERAQSRVDDVVSFVVESFEEAVHAQT
ncbi:MULTISPECIES: ATP synthase archaeal subunit H [unclassified Haladaptatus]|uniref:ATP synthase archaeal subunit H n=1 Tax=unclassified Haladaptatus TaxID=2622732 RepID=UPI002FCDF1EB